ncbi:MAG: hypothetical protein HQ481_07465 [Alphaproteobacteria bacterium]|nr:hypothetical protein [Alphaproteobacteria bacterium]
MHRWMLMCAVATAALAGSFLAETAVAGPLENLERERARLVLTLLDPAIDADTRHTETDRARRRLVDLERVALRDPAVRGDTGPVARRAFADYDLTFLAHASIEKGVMPLDLWLERVGVTTARLMAARVGRR